MTGRNTKSEWGDHSDVWTSPYCEASSHAEILRAGEAVWPVGWGC